VASQDADVFVGLRHEEGVHVGQRALAEVSHAAVADVHLAAGQQGQCRGVVIAAACCLALGPDYAVVACAGYVWPPSVGGVSWEVVASHVRWGGGGVPPGLEPDYFGSGLRGGWV
jgi:hypothetical protein